MTEAVAYAIYCVGLEGLNTSLEALIYVYDAGLSSLVAVKRHYTLPIACTDPR